MEWTCFKAHIYGKCQICQEYYRQNTPEIVKAVKELIEKYPWEVKELIGHKNG